MNVACAAACERCLPAYVIYSLVNISIEHFAAASCLFKSRASTIVVHVQYLKVNCRVSLSGEVSCCEIIKCHFRGIKIAPRIVSLCSRF